MKLVFNIPICMISSASFHYFLLKTKSVYKIYIDCSFLWAVMEPLGHKLPIVPSKSPICDIITRVDSRFLRSRLYQSRPEQYCTEILVCYENAKFFVLLSGWWLCHEYFQSVYKTNIYCSLILEMVRNIFTLRKIAGPSCPVTSGLSF